MSKQTLRSKVEEFFNPGPVGSHALDNDGADSNDEHMKSYFKFKSEVKHDLPRRKINVNIEMDPKFKAKAVTRADLDRQSSEGSQSGSSAEEYGEEEMDESDAEEYGEQEIDESDASSELSNHVRP